jgi:hypothetical protein
VHNIYAFYPKTKVVKKLNQLTLSLLVAAIDHNREHFIFDVTVCWLVIVFSVIILCHRRCWLPFVGLFVSKVDN